MEEKRKVVLWISSVLDYFIYDAVTEKSACCVKHANVECGKQISNGNSTNLIGLLRAIHKAQFAEFEEKEKKRKAAIIACRPKPSSASLTASSQSMKHGVDKITSLLTQPATYSATSREALIRNDAFVSFVIRAGLATRVAGN